MYAGFWKRFLAYLIDYAATFFLVILFIFIWAILEILLYAYNIDQKTRELLLGFLGVPLYLSLTWLYYAFFESSKLKATLGKLALGIVVVDVNNNRISFLRASARHWSKVLSVLIFFVGFLMAGFTKDKRALHDIISGTYVKNKTAVTIDANSNEVKENI